MTEATRNAALTALFPNMTSFVAFDLMTYGKDSADIRALAIAPFNTEGPSADVKAFDFRSERKKDDCSAPEGAKCFRDMRDHIKAILSDAPIVVVHDCDTIRTLKTRLPNWEPPLVLSTQRLALVSHPYENSYSLPNLIDSQNLDQRYALHEQGPKDRCPYRSIAIGYLFLLILNAVKEHGYTESNIKFVGKPRNI